MYKIILSILMIYISSNTFAAEQKPSQFTADGYKIINNTVAWEILEKNKPVLINNVTDNALMVFVAVGFNYYNDPVKVTCDGKELTLTYGNSVICGLPAREVFKISIKDEDFTWGSEGNYGFF